MRGWRRPIGTLLILTPLLVVVGFGLLGVRQVLGSMGMDIHWNSRGTFYGRHDVLRSDPLCLCRGGRSLAKKPKNLEGQLSETRLLRERESADSPLTMRMVCCHKTEPNVNMLAKPSNLCRSAASPGSKLLKAFGMMACVVSFVASAFGQGKCRDGYSTPICPLTAEVATAPIQPVFAPTGWTTVALDHITFRVADYPKEAAFYIVRWMGWRLRNDDGAAGHPGTSAPGVRSSSETGAWPADHRSG